MNLLDILENVKDRSSFLEFLEALIEDKNKNQDEWQNTTVEDYLDSAKSWLEDSGRNDLSWKLLAEFLYCGKIYE